MLTSLRMELHFIKIKWLRIFLSRQRRTIEKSSDFAPMVIVPVSGGLGNQIWQYAIGAIVSRCSGLPVKYDLMWNYGPVLDIKCEARRDFELTRLFPLLVINEASEEESLLYRRYFWREPKYQCVFDEETCFSKRARYLGGFYANARYMALLPRDFWDQFEFKLELGHESKITMERIRAPNSVAVHVRRGDFAGSIHDVVTTRYYRQAVDFLHKTSVTKPIFFVFSDNINWTEGIFEGIHGNFVYVNPKSDFPDAFDFYLMSQCKHFITANSTFSWMAAWLGKKEKSIVTMPDRWFNKKAPRHIFYGNEKSFYVDGYTIIQC